MADISIEDGVRDTNTHDRGTDLVAAQIQALTTDAERHRTPLARVSDRVGRSLAELLVYALAGNQGMRRRGRRA